MDKMPTFTWSSFQRDPKKVDVALRHHGRVALKRREGGTVFLVDEDEAQGDSIAVELVTSFLASSPNLVPSKLPEILEGAWPWLSFLSPPNQQHFLTDFIKTARACSSLQEMRPLKILVQQWKNTASAIAAGVDLSTPLDPDESLPPVS